MLLFLILAHLSAFEISYKNALYKFTVIIICCRHVSVRPSDTLRYCTKTASRKQRPTIAHGMARILVFWVLTSRISAKSNRLTPNRGAPGRGRVGSNRLLSTTISLYLKNRCKIWTWLLWMRIETRMRSIKWRYIQWPRVTFNYPKPSHFRYFVPSCISS